ncbi:MAG: DUF5683 domain-containing protein, partial [Lutibacter sp.]|nr:DUF5683 domain-containing protein [Lutibacter sp.]
MLKKKLYSYLLIAVLTVFTGYAQTEAEIKIQDNIKPSSDNFKPLSPAKAAFYSAVLPGLGQAFNKKYWKIPIVYGALGSGVYFYHTNNDNFNRVRSAYKLRINE